MGEESLTMMTSFPDLMVALLDYKLAEWRPPSNSERTMGEV